ncbi:hypothetical protein H0B56_05960 [Haloechinothrix sp. YIM 98757]|uniref:Uncharacterized protein n=1 Tax=Haloechinothrix aidingensis TaxID=2752311 RepID=A0A838A1Q0_9PSEU|nr:hypothetical protein [Haloechinothrix aidingensis]MBA0125083.1 hypothetical protein [Haloechinothrix aidingensis]
MSAEPVECVCMGHTDPVHWTPDCETARCPECTRTRGEYVPRASVLVDYAGRETIREADGTVVETEPDGTSRVVRRP